MVLGVIMAGGKGRVRVYKYVGLVVVTECGGRGAHAHHDCDILT